MWLYNMLFLEQNGDFINSFYKTFFFIHDAVLWNITMNEYLTCKELGTMFGTLTHPAMLWKPPNY